jgi:hypothetical protein
MASWNDVREIALGLPLAEEGVRDNHAMWTIKGKSFAWERPLRKSDLAALGPSAPTGEILCVYVADEDEKLGHIGSAPDVFFTTPHFNGYPAVLLQLDRADLVRLREVLTDAWLARAPKREAAAFLAAGG